MEACGHYPWFERLLAQLGLELWLGTRPGFGPRWCASRRPTGGTRSSCSCYCGKIGFRASGCRVWRSGTYGSCWCIATSKCRRGHGQEPVASAGAEPGGAAASASCGPRQGGRSWRSWSCCPTRGAARALAGHPGSTGSGDRRTEPAGGRRSGATAGGGEADDASGSRAGDGAGHGADAGSGATLRNGPQGGQLLRADSERAFQRRAAAAGTHQQAGQFVSALFAGGSGTVVRRAMSRSWAASIAAWRCASIVGWRKWRSRASWRRGCT